MIRDINIATTVSKLMLDVSDRLEESVVMIKKSSAPDEFTNYRGAVAGILGEILINVLNPIYSEHPSLKPPGFE